MSRSSGVVNKIMQISGEMNIHIYGAIQPDLHVIRSCNQLKSHNSFGTGTGYGKVKKTRQFLTPKTTKGMQSRI